MTNQELQLIADKLYRKYFNASLNCPVMVNNRLSRTGGEEYYDYDTHTYDIQISSMVIKHFPRVVVIGMLKHELCHYYIDHKYPNARPHGKEFKHVLKRIKGIYRGTMILYDYNPKKALYVYQCKDCGKYFYLNTSNGVGHYFCRCGGDLKLVGKELMSNYLHDYLTSQYRKASCNTSNIIPSHVQTLQSVQMSLF